MAQGGGVLAERGASAGRAVVMMIGGLGQCMKVVGRPLSLMVGFRLGQVLGGWSLASWTCRSGFCDDKG